jgi:tight adherence protein C
MPLWALLTFFLFTMTAVLAALSAFLGRSTSAAPAQQTSLPFDQPVLRPFQAALHDLFRGIGRNFPAANAENNPWRRRLSAAGYRWPSAVPVFYGLKTGLAVFLGVAMAMLGLGFGVGLTSAFLGCMSGMALGWLMPDRLVVVKSRARGRRLRSAIPSALDILAISLEAGQSLDVALMDAARALRTAYRDLSEELFQVRLELRASSSRADALRRLATRTGEPDIRKLSTLLIDADRFGTTLGPALRSHARMLRTRFRQQGQEAARKVGVKLIFPVFFLIFPSVLLVTLGPACIMLMQQLHSFGGF